jgi:DNA-binding MarR family transcriptional regulator
MTNQTQDLMMAFGRVLRSPFFRTAMASNMQARRDSDKELGRGRLRLLALLSEEDGLTNADIAEKLDIRPSSVSAQVTALADDEMIERRTSEEDGRVSLIFITEKGREALAALHSDNDEMSEKAFAALSEEERAQLADMLRRVAAATEEIEVTPEMMHDAFRGFHGHHGHRGHGRRMNHEMAEGRRGMGEGHRRMRHGMGEGRRIWIRF